MIFYERDLERVQHLITENTRLFIKVVCMKCHTILNTTFVFQIKTKMVSTITTSIILLKIILNV